MNGKCPKSVKNSSFGTNKKPALGLFGSKKFINKFFE